MSSPKCATLSLDYLRSKKTTSTDDFPAKESYLWQGWPCSWQTKLFDSCRSLPRNCMYGPKPHIFYLTLTHAKGSVFLFLCLTFPISSVDKAVSTDTRCSHWLTAVRGAIINSRCIRGRLSRPINRQWYEFSVLILNKIVRLWAASNQHGRKNDGRRVAVNGNCF